MNLASAIRDVNPSRLVVFSSLLVFSTIFGLRLDNIIEWSYWVVFFPIWCWKLLAISGACVGLSIWIRHPNFRNEATIQFKSMLIYGALNAVLLIFEILVCAKTDSTLRILWILVFLPLLVLSVVSIGLCVWSARHEKPFEMELFFSANLLLFVFVPIKLDGFVSWSWAVVLIPLWIVMAVTIVAVLYGVILAAFLWRSPDVNPAQKRASLSIAVGYACAVVPLLVFEILLTGKLDDTVGSGNNAAAGSYASMSFSSIFAVLDLALCALVCTSFTARGSNQWWFGIRKEFGQFVLDTCPLLQEYGNVEYKFPESMTNRSRRPARRTTRRMQRTGSLILTRGGTAMRFDLAALSGSDVDVATPSSVTFSDLHAFGFDEPLASSHANPNVNPHDSGNASSLSRSPPNAIVIDRDSVEAGRRTSRTLPQRHTSGSVGRSQSLGVAVARRADRRAPVAHSTSVNPRVALDDSVAGPTASQRVSARTGRIRGLFRSAVTTHAQREQVRQLERVQIELQRSGELRTILGLRPSGEDRRPASSSTSAVVMPAPVSSTPSPSSFGDIVTQSEPRAIAQSSTSRNESVRSEGASRSSMGPRRRSDDAVIEIDSADGQAECEGVNVMLTRTPSLRVASGSVASVPRSTMQSGSRAGSSNVEERRSNPSLTSRANTSRLRVGVCNTPVLLHVDVHSSNETSLNGRATISTLPDDEIAQPAAAVPTDSDNGQFRSPSPAACADLMQQQQEMGGCDNEDESEQIQEQVAEAVVDRRADSRRPSESSQQECPPTQALLAQPSPSPPQSPSTTVGVEPHVEVLPSQSATVQLSVPPPTYAASQHLPVVASSTPPPYSSSPGVRPPLSHSLVSGVQTPAPIPAPAPPVQAPTQAMVSSRFFASLSRHLRSHSGGSRAVTKKQRFADDRKNSMTQDWLYSNAPLSRSIYTPD